MTKLEFKTVVFTIVEGQICFDNDAVELFYSKQNKKIRTIES